MNDGQRRAALATFLRTRRMRLSPAAVGLPPGVRRRTPGLRREEVAVLAEVGATWYTWLEQGRDVRPSVEVLESVAIALRLDATERRHLFHLADRPLPGSPTPTPDTVSPTLLRMLNGFGTTPAYIKGRRWDVLAWNRAASAVILDFDSLPLERRNMVELIFTDPELRRRFADWESVARTTLAMFRADSGRYPGDPGIVNLVDRLLYASAEFRAWWPQHAVVARPEGRKEWLHPAAGCLLFEYARFSVDDGSDLKLVMYTPLVGTDTASKIEHLLASSCDAAPRDTDARRETATVLTKWGDTWDGDIAITPSGDIGRTSS